MTKTMQSGAHVAGYGYRYWDKLYSVTTNFPDETPLVYDYGADGNRRTRDTGVSGDLLKYKYDLGHNLIGMEKGSGAASTAFVHMPGAVSEVLASLDGSNPAGTAGNYYFHDNLGSVRCAAALGEESNIPRRHPATHIYIAWSTRQASAAGPPQEFTRVS